MGFTAWPHSCWRAQQRWTGICPPKIPLLIHSPLPWPEAHLGYFPAKTAWVTEDWKSLQALQSPALPSSRNLSTALLSPCRKTGSAQSWEREGGHDVCMLSLFFSPVLVWVPESPHEMETSTTLQRTSSKSESYITAILELWSCGTAGVCRVNAPMSNIEMCIHISLLYRALPASQFLLPQHWAGWKCPEQPYYNRRRWKQFSSSCGISLLNNGWFYGYGFIPWYYIIFIFLFICFKCISILWCNRNKKKYFCYNWKK